jgi:hypothetical protein
MDSLFIDNIRPQQRLLSVFGQLNMVVMHVALWPLKLCLNLKPCPNPPQPE